MGLTGLEIYKQLPKKNCGECGPPTCLAFAMSLAAGKASLDACPYVSDAAREALEAASAPPIALVKVGVGDNVVELGDETELFRHDKKFYHETAMAFTVSDTMSEEELNARLDEINGLTFVRVGLEYKIQFVAVKNDSGDAAAFKKAVETVAGKTNLALILISEDTGAMEQALSVVAARKPLIYAATADNYEQMTELAKKNECPLAVKGNDLSSLAELVEKVVGLGHKQLVIDPGSRETSRAIADFTQIRRQAIKKRFRPFGYPIIAFTTEEDPLAEVVQAVAYISKYASVVVMNTTEKAHVLPLLSWRQNLYTDPQVPIQVEEKLNAVGDVNENSPVYITTNFSLTYYSVEGEVEASKIPSYILPVDTDGTSVLTAYAAGKFEAEKIAEVLKKSGVEEKVSHRTVVIPGYVAVLKGKLEEASGWKVLVGPREASGIPAFAKSQFA
ncbi:acetyl-CoA decarbonylase/synthase complex subunit gamma [Calderihabitans maritimus]|uniref:Acetyl-CoA decarbonylase/synthase complex subunit gamma n=1 Tax=Calderihabitans maritimus TaxID=1246530 RepID=A0A1Z5HQM9_9FIRM|nr:acetyl-CoA decarbonylase/synthase complex subunit gamma [Calderihabitans maritimus]GAW91836.1 acetyl-CoA decarbonylase/synthase complex subunit gamma [Calderihabitans maritimus]